MRQVARGTGSFATVPHKPTRRPTASLTHATALIVKDDAPWTPDPQTLMLSDRCLPQLSREDRTIFNNVFYKIKFALLIVNNLSTAVLNTFKILSIVHAFSSRYLILYIII